MSSNYLDFTKGKASVGFSEGIGSVDVDFSNIIAS